MTTKSDGTAKGAITSPPRYFAVWRLAIAAVETGVVVRPGSPSTAPSGAGHIFVPAFSLARVVVENLGVRLTQRNPMLEGTAVPSFGGQSAAGGLFSPVLLGRQDARLLSGFVYTGLSVREGRAPETIDSTLATFGEELVFIPAVWDPRCVHDANWRPLLREFDEAYAEV